MKENKKKKKLSFIISLLVSVFVGALAGFLGINLIADTQGVKGAIIFLVSLFVSIYLHLIIHEGGHLLAGLISGYKFVSFRVGSIIWIKKDGRFLRKSFSIPGTAGQCLLKAPGIFGEDYPSIFYNLGGGLANIITACIAGVFCLLFDDILLRLALVPFILSGVYLAASNLIPLKVGGIANDGMNVKMLKSDVEARKGFWCQLEINMLQTEGERLKDIPEEYFHLGNEDDLANPLITAVVLMRGQRCMDQRNFDEGRELLEQLCFTNKPVMDLYRWEAGSDILFLELIGERRKEVIDRIATPELLKYLKQNKESPAKLRTLFAYHKLYTLDEKQARKAKTLFDKAIKRYPMAGEIEGEIELMEGIQ
ncbi:hypothetical protein M2140_001753 [Clostridiales Family XIII bacterium PM5-7]